MPTSVAREIFAKYAKSMPVDPLQIANDLGIYVHPISKETLITLDQNPADYASVCGAALKVGGKKIILYRRSDGVKRQRFTIAHELGHHVLGHTVNGRQFRDEAYSTGNKLETDANNFAAELLVPLTYLKHAIAKHGANSIEELAEIFFVSDSVMAIRLEHLNRKLDF